MTGECLAILPGFYRISDTCNVYLLVKGTHALVFDFGSGAWIKQLPALGIRHIDHVLLTHHHADQCHGLSSYPDAPWVVHAPAGEERFLDPDAADAFPPPPWFGSGCPASYAAPVTRIPGIQYDLHSFSRFSWGDFHLQVLHTPGHGPNACSFVITHAGKQIVICGDAAYAGGTIWEPYHLEWDHWTGTGALAAWEGIERLRGLAIDLLCPAHGPIIDRSPRRMLATLSARLLAFYRAKGPISPGSPDRFLPATTLPGGTRQYLPHLYQFGENGYLLVSASGEGLVVDPQRADLPALSALCDSLCITPSEAVVSHYHFDHCDGIPALREQYGTRAILHPRVAEPWQNPAQALLPWLLPEPIHPDALWPHEGTWDWQEYRFQVAPWPGQTWWHCAFQTEIDGRRVLFAGDSFQPASIWNGTGGFCAFNNSRFHEGYAPSAQRALAWQPEIVAAGHGNCYAFDARKFQRIMRWAEHAEAAVRALCPSGDLDTDYYAVHAHLRSRFAEVASCR